MRGDATRMQAQRARLVSHLEILLPQVGWLEHVAVGVDSAVEGKVFDLVGHEAG